MVMAFANVLAEEIWTSKYRYRSEEGDCDQDYDATISRVARAVAAAERPDRRAYWEAKFAEALSGFRFIPAGRILAGAGTGRSVTLFNCFVMGTIPDDMSGIFEHLREAALTMQQGGGIGYDFSTLRPKGAPVRPNTMASAMCAGSHSAAPGGGLYLSSRASKNAV